jgi:hypothetical protein
MTEYQPEVAKKSGEEDIEWKCHGIYSRLGHDGQSPHLGLETKTEGQNVMRAKQQGLITHDGFAEAGEASEAAARTTDTLMRKHVSGGLPQGFVSTLKIARKEKETRHHPPPFWT